MSRKDTFRKKRKLNVGRFLTVLLVPVLLIAAYIIFTSLSKGPSSKNDPVPTPTVAPQATMDAVEPTPQPEETPPPTPTPEPTAIKAENIVSEALPSAHHFKWDIFSNGKWSQSYQREYEMVFPDAEEYSDLEGVVTFRGNHYRNSPSYGFANVKEEKLEAVWEIGNGASLGWTGVGWNGQPAIVRWSDEIKNIMNINAEKKAKKDLVEVIYATLDGNIYFLDLEDGKQTRPPIKTGYPHKGSVSVDPRGYPLLYAGQGISDKSTDPFLYRIFSLIDQKVLYTIDGRDADALRRWGAFDSVGLIDKKTDNFIECAENGLVYSMKLNTKLDLNAGSISIAPELTKYRYRAPSSAPKNATLGTENSPVIYRNLMYFINNSGTLQCIDLNTLSPVWVRSVTDDTDSTMVLEDKGDGEVYLYTACEVDMQGEDGYSYVRKIHALTGKLMWEKKYKAAFHKTNGGALASPVLGKNDIDNLVIFNICKTKSNGNGSKLMALDRETGEEVWLVDMEQYCWSSPVSVYTETGKSYIVQCDSTGIMHLYEGKTGNHLDSISLGSNVEASPAAFNDMLVVGTRGQKIWGIRIK